MTPRRREFLPSTKESTSTKTSRLLHNEQDEERRRIAKTKSLELTTTLQEWITTFVPRAVTVWLVVLAGLILLDSIQLTCKQTQWLEFDIDTPVMVAIVGSTTIAIVGLVHSAIKGIFDKNSDR